MKGVNKRVVEIIEPQNEYIERVIVFLRQSDGEIKVANGKSEAEKYVSGLVCWRRKWWPKQEMLMKIGMAAGALLLLGGLAFWLLR